MSKRLFQIVFVSMCCILFVGCYGSKNSRYNQNNQNNQLAVENAQLKQQVKQLEEDKIALEVQVKNLGADLEALKTSTHNTENTDDSENANAVDNIEAVETIGINPFEELGFEFSPLMPTTINGLGYYGDGYIQFDSWTITDFRETHINDESLIVEIEMVGIKHGSPEITLYYYDAEGYALGHDSCYLTNEVNDSSFRIKKNFYIKEGTTRIEMKVE